MPLTGAYALTVDHQTFNVSVLIKKNRKNNMFYLKNVIVHAIFWKKKELLVGKNKKIMYFGFNKKIEK